MAGRYSPEYLKDILVRLKDPKEGIKLKKKQIEKKKKVQSMQGLAMIEWMLRDLGERSIVSKGEVVSTIQALIDRRLICTADGVECQPFHDGEDYIFQEEAQESLELEILLKDSELTTIEMVAQAMSNESGGVPLSTKKHRLKKYKNCFSGQEAVAWFSSNLMLSKPEDSLALGQYLQNKGFIANVISKTEPFSDKSSSVFRLSDSIDGGAVPVTPGRSGSSASLQAAPQRSASPARPLPPVSTPGGPGDNVDARASPGRGLARPPSLRGARGARGAARPAPPRGAAPRGTPPQRGFVQGRGQPGRGRRQAPLLGQSERRASPTLREDNEEAAKPPPPRTRPPPRSASTTGVVRANPVPPPPQRQMTVDVMPTSSEEPMLDIPPDAEEIGGLTKPPVAARPPAPTRPHPTAATRSSENLVQPPARAPPPQRPSSERPPLPAAAPPATMQRAGSAQWARPAPRRGSTSGSPSSSPSPTGAARKASSPARDISVTIGKPADEIGLVKQQLLTTEQAFVNTSFACLKAYCDDVPDSVLSTKEKEQIFGNLNELVEMHYNILSTVNDATRPSDILAQVVPHLHLYLSYIANSQRAHQVLSIVRERPAFADVLQEASSRGLFTIEGLLESPAGRLDEFPPMITDFVQRLGNNQEEAQALRSTLDKFLAVQHEKNRRKCLPEHLMRVWDIEHSFLYDENIKMDMSTAMLVNEGSMNVVQDTRAEAKPGDQITIFVFNDMYIVALPTNGYALKSLIRAQKDKLSVRDVPAAESPNALELLEVDYDRKIVVTFPTSKEKRKWMSDLPVRYHQVMRMTIPLPL